MNSTAKESGPPSRADRNSASSWALPTNARSRAAFEPLSEAGGSDHGSDYRFAGPSVRLGVSGPTSSRAAGSGSTPSPPVRSFTTGLPSLHPRRDSTLETISTLADQ
jgi:hypothetical protein